MRVFALPGGRQKGCILGAFWARFGDPFLAPFWGPFFWLPLGVPVTVRFVRKHKGNKTFWAFDVSPERSIRGLFWASFWLPIWDLFRWSFRAARGDGNIVFSHFICFKIIIVSIQLLPQAAGRKQCHSIPLKYNVPFVSRQFCFKTTTPDRPQQLENKIRLKGIL